MSLVAYCASDESDAEDTEEQTTVKAGATGVDAISDDEDEKPRQAAANLTQTLATDESPTTLLKGLPAPKAAEGRLPDGEEELEDLVKPKTAELLNAPKPPPKRSGQPVKISIPVIQQDSDDEDESLPANRPKSSGKSGLIGLLPPPQYSSRKEANRPLVPHTLTKKRPAPAPAKPASKPAPPKPVSQPSLPGMKAAPLLGMEYSDSEEDEDVPAQNFFSLNEPIPEKRARLDPDVDAAPVGATLPSRSAVAQAGPGTSGEEGEGEMEASPVLQDAPLQFGRTTLSAGPAALSAYSSLSGRGAHLSAGQSSLPAYHVSGPKYPSAEEEQAAGSSDMYGQAYPDYSEESGVSNVNNLMQDEQFLRLQGKKSRGKEEINIIDANMDEFVTTATAEMAKNFTEETAYQSHRKSDNMPTPMQRRKKQITYLAFQAKERELELKNSWAQNRMTKRQTQSKYGF